MITIERLRELLSYDPETGVFRWLVQAGRAGGPGSIAGSKGKTGYWSVCVDGRMYRAHRLAWFFMNGRWPESDIDHRDGDRLNNRISNLRECKRHENLENQAVGKRNKSGLLGVSWDSKEGRWRSAIGKHGHTYHLGYFATKEEAHAAYLAAKKHLHKFQPVLRDALRGAT